MIKIAPENVIINLTDIIHVHDTRSHFQLLASLLLFPQRLEQKPNEIIRLINISYYIAYISFKKIPLETYNAIAINLCKIHVAQHIKLFNTIIVHPNFTFYIDIIR